MTSAGQVVAFAGVIALAAASPGPDFAVVVRRSMVAGHRHGVAAGFGVATGVFVWSVAAAMGVAAILEASAVAFTAVKLVGAAYLMWLGVNALLAARRGSSGPEISAVRDTGARLRSSYRDGVLCNTLNPKCGVFFMAVLPQFVPMDGRPADVLLLSSVAVVVTITWFTIVATLVAALRRLLARPRVRRTIDALTGAVLVTLGLRLATTSV
jgi:RhtB (resistance to homoserine/threonine) family protein